jgi:hypothetical protein
VARMAHRSCSGLPEIFLPLFPPLYPWIHGLFPTIEFAIAPCPSLPVGGMQKHLRQILSKAVSKL